METHRVHEEALFGALRNNGQGTVKTGLPLFHPGDGLKDKKRRRKNERKGAIRAAAIKAGLYKQRVM